MIDVEDFCPDDKKDVTINVEATNVPLTFFTPPHIVTVAHRPAT